MLNTQRKTIMHLIATNFYGGPEKQIVEHLLRLRKEEYRGVVTSFIENNAPNEILARAKTASLDQYGIPMSGPIDVRALFMLVTLLKRERVDILCAHGYKSTILGWIAARMNGTPVIAFSRGYTAENRKVAFYEWLDRLVLRKVDGIVAVSAGQSRTLDALGVHGCKRWVVHNAALINHVKNGEGEELRQSINNHFHIPKDSMLVVTAGRLSPEKGHRFLVEAIALMRGVSENVCFLFCGDGVCRYDLERQADHLGVGWRCRFAGFRHDIEKIFRAMDIMALPSLTEGLPNVVLEAFACGKPVVATAVGGVPEIVVHGENGLLVPPGRPDLIADALTQLLADPQRMFSMGRQGYRKVKDEFSFDAQAQVLMGIYREFIGRSDG